MELIGISVCIFLVAIYNWYKIDSKDIALLEQKYALYRVRDNVCKLVMRGEIYEDDKVFDQFRIEVHNMIVEIENVGFSHIVHEAYNRIGNKQYLATVDEFFGQLGKMPKKFVEAVRDYNEILQKIVSINSAGAIAIYDKFLADIDEDAKSDLSGEDQKILAAIDSAHDFVISKVRIRIVKEPVVVQNFFSSTRDTAERILDEAA